MDMTIKDMLDMQNRLFNKYGVEKKWLTYTPDNAQLHWLYMLGEAGEVIDVMKKKGCDALCEDGPDREHLIEEMADTMMFFVDTMACLNVTPEEFAEKYREKHEKNMHRWE